MMTESDAAHLSPDLEPLPGLPARPTSDEDLETFLSNVDQVTNLISKLATADSEAELDRLRDDADEFIAKFARATEKTARLKMIRDGGGGGANDVPGNGLTGEDDVDDPKISSSSSSSSPCKPLLKNVCRESGDDADASQATSVDSSSAVSSQSKNDDDDDDDDDGNPWRVLKKEDDEQRRLLRESRANDWREKGNKAFKTGDFELAYYCYSRGLDSKRDCTALWTNRAQALIKMEVFEDALDDCAAAIALCPDCPKAYVHRGRAHLGLNKFDEAETAFEEVARIDPKYQKCVNVYLKQVADARGKEEGEGKTQSVENGEIEGRSEGGVKKREIEEENAEKTSVLSEGEAQPMWQEKASQQSLKPVQIPKMSGGSNPRQRYSADVTSTLNMMRVPDQHMDYYVSGLKILTMELVDMTTTTVFRTADGFDLLTEKHAVIHAALMKPFKDLSPSEIELHDTLFKVLASVCDRNVENQRRCAAADVLPEIILKFLSLPFPHLCKEAALRLMHVLVNSELGRDAIVGRFDAALLLSALFSAARDGRRPEGAASAVFATMVFTRLAPDKKYKVNMRDKFAHLVLPAFETLIRSSFRADDDDYDGVDTDDGNDEVPASDSLKSLLLGAAVPTPEDVAVIPSSFAVMAVLATDPVLRSLLAGRVNLWTACLDLLQKSIAQLITSASSSKQNLVQQPQRDSLTSSTSPSKKELRTLTARDVDNRYVHKMILHMLGFLINISQEDSPHRLRFAADICGFCVQLLKLQEPKSLWHSRSFLNSPPPPLSSSASSNSAASSPSTSSDADSCCAAASATPSLSNQASTKSFSLSSKSAVDDSAVAGLKSASIENSEERSASAATNVKATTNPLPKPASSPSSSKKDSMPLEEEPHESTRALVLLSLLLPQNDKFVENFVSANGIGPLISFIQYGTKNQVKASVKVTAVCAQQCPAARDDIVSCRKALASIVLLLKHDDEHVIGNAALCLTHCIEVPKVPEKLTKTNIVKHLLVLARDARKIGVQENCAILLAKLAMKENRHLQRLRELHGIEILHTCMKHIKT